MRTNWKSGLLAMGLAAATLATSAVGQIGIVIGRNPPPPLRRERRTPAPGPGYAWVDGYWRYDHNRYVWVPGRWDRAPYAGATWNHGHYDRYDDGWHYDDGHWDRDRDDRRDDRH